MGNCSYTEDERNWALITGVVIALIIILLGYAERRHGKNMGASIIIVVLALIYLFILFPIAISCPENNK